MEQGSERPAERAPITVAEKFEAVVRELVQAGDIRSFRVVQGKARELLEAVDAPGGES